MPLVTSQGYQLMPNNLGAIQQGFNLGQNIQQGVLRTKLQREEQEKQEKLKGLRGKALGVGDGGEVERIVNAPAIEKETRTLMDLGLDTQEKRKSAKDFSRKIESTPDDELLDVINERIGDITSKGGDPRDTMQLLEMTPQQIRGTTEMVDMIIDRDAVRQMFAIDPQSAASFLDSIDPSRRSKMTGVKRTSSQNEFDQFASMPEGTEEEKLRKTQFGRMIGAIGKAASTEEKMRLDKFRSALKIGESGKIESGKLEAKLKYKPLIAESVKKAEAKAKAEGEAFSLLKKSEAALPGLEEATRKLKELAPMATSTIAGRAYDAAVKEAGFDTTEGANARAKFIAIVNNQVLPLLKQTFGAAFTEKEGETLKATMGDPNASPEQKMQTLDAFIDQKKRDIKSLQNELDEGGTIEEWRAKRKEQKAQTLSDEDLLKKYGGL